MHAAVMQGMHASAVTYADLLADHESSLLPPHAEARKLAVEIAVLVIHRRLALARSSSQNN